MALVGPCWPTGPWMRHGGRGFRTRAAWTANPTSEPAKDISRNVCVFMYICSIVFYALHFDMGEVSI